MNPVLLFSGQGAQYVGMGRDLAAQFPTAKTLFAQADDILGFPLTQTMFEGPIEDLTRTSRCQPALYLHGLACLAVLTEHRPELSFAAAAGLSLGEFTAHAAAGTFDFATGLRLVHLRGTFMEEACQSTAGAMAAMIGGSEDDVRNLAAACQIDVANFNAPGQIVLSGSKKGIAKALANAKSHGIRMGKELAVAGAYHSRLMASAQSKLAAELANLNPSTPSFPVISNVTAAPVSSPDEIRRTLESQVTGSVRWSESMRYLLDQGHSPFLELGPGGILSGLMSRIEKGTQVLPVSDPASLASTLTHL